MFHLLVITMITVQPSDYKDYLDENNNEIIINDTVEASNSQISFDGNNNSVVFGKKISMKRFNLQFHGDNGHFRIGDNSIFSGDVLLGSDCSARIGNNFESAGVVLINAAEKTSVTVGSYCRFNAHIQIRTHDSHPIFDIDTHERINESKSIHIGNKVWLGNSVSVLKGVWIGDNCVVGMHSIVTKDIRNNCLAVGNPAEIKKENIDWGLEGLTRLPFPSYKHIAI
jgi:acetyltransferase-like isoleucine patch superfamily enzyme